MIASVWLAVSLIYYHHENKGLYAKKSIIRYLFLFFGRGRGRGGRANA